MAKSISAKVAQERHGVVAFHQEMDNGELRFRLKHESGSAYIRTEASLGSGWQDSHFHRHVRETYIVETGWMGFAELVGNALSVRILERGETLTTNPGVVHNVYLPADAVIHTVKYGSEAGEDRAVNQQCEVFDAVTKALTSEVQIRAVALKPTKASRYSDEYRHFDTLIWQVPAWSTAVFAISGPMMIEASKSVSGDPSDKGASGLLLLLSLCLFVFGTVLYRFRTHQWILKGYRPTRFWKSAQSWIQAVIAVQYSTLLGFGLNLYGFSRISSILAGVAVLIITLIFFERQVRIETVEEK